MYRKRATRPQGHTNGHADTHATKNMHQDSLKKNAKRRR